MPDFGEREVASLSTKDILDWQEKIIAKGFGYKYKKKQELIERIAHSLDITPEMYDQSQSVVRGLTNYVKNIDPSVVVYKQGSFKLGTIIRPYRKDKYGDFDIDLVVQFSDRREQVKPSDIKQRLGEYLEKSNYKKFLDEEGSRCWTLNYPHMYGNTILSITTLSALIVYLAFTGRLRKVKYKDLEIGMDKDGKTPESRSLINKFIDEVL